MSVHQRSSRLQNDSSPVLFHRTTLKRCRVSHLTPPFVSDTILHCTRSGVIQVVGNGPVDEIKLREVETKVGSED